MGKKKLTKLQENSREWEEERNGAQTTQRIIVSCVEFGFCKELQSSALKRTTMHFHICESRIDKTMPTKCCNRSNPRFSVFFPDSLIKYFSLYFLSVGLPFRTNVRGRTWCVSYSFSLLAYVMNWFLGVVDLRIKHGNKALNCSLWSANTWIEFEFEFSWENEVCKNKRCELKSSQTTIFH